MSYTYKCRCPILYFSTHGILYRCRFLELILLRIDVEVDTEQFHRYLDCRCKLFDNSVLFYCFEKNSSRLNLPIWRLLFQIAINAAAEGNFVTYHHIVELLGFWRENILMDSRIRPSRQLWMTWTESIHKTCFCEKKIYRPNESLTRDYFKVFNIPIYVHGQNFFCFIFRP